MSTPLSLEERALGLDNEKAAILRRFGVAPTALAKSMIAAAERDPAAHPELAPLLVALRMSGKDPIASLTFSFAGGRPALTLRPGVL
jgi:hypothetical protein